MRLCCCILSFEVSGMKTIGNILWFIFGGWLAWISHVFFGILLCITIIGIPWGKQHFKMAGLALHPFGHKVLVDL